MTQNETYGEVTRAELAEMRVNAQPCLTCGMLATVDPIAHQSRYGHAPVIAGEHDGRLEWSTGSLAFLPVTPATLPGPARYTCWRCGMTFPAGVTGHTDDNPCD